MRALILPILLVLSGCQSGTPNAHTSRDSLDWEGVYRGVLPCADCAGIETTLRITEDGKYELTSTYLGKASTSIVDRGSFDWHDDGGRIALRTRQGPRYFRVEENRLRQLDTHGNRVEGALAENYLLRKIDVSGSTATLENTYWKLVQLGSTRVGVTDNHVEPHFILHPDENRVSGSGGCNRLLGSYQVDGNRLSFSRMAGTMMACTAGMELERAFHEALGHVTTWRISGEELELLDATGGVVAKFESVYLR